MTTMYQFQVDRRPAGPLRFHWKQAANDAVSSGHAVWVKNDQIKHGDMCEVAEVEVKPWDLPIRKGLGVHMAAAGDFKPHHRKRWLTLGWLIWLALIAIVCSVFVLVGR